ncbi:DUF4405 domain-containing protein [Pectinatus haikarae]|uniref:Cytochrome b subunit of formate dehydrogenase n=1 Tax=Pectinatus haikarae TaxID=349096 RepID=A0ABT9Y7U4_9FIRM|nr:cytochrome b subunit of formate dehydrogenase [Pectinatus haikarae]
MKKIIFYTLMLSFIIISLTGICLSLKVYRLFNYKIIHEIFSYIFLISSIFHIYVNRNSISHYLKNK